MFRKTIIIICFQVLFLTFILKAEISYDSTSISIPKIQAAYWGIKPVEKAKQQLKLLKKHGLNTALVKDGSYHVNSKLWREWATIASEFGIQLFPVLNFAGPPEIKQLAGKFVPYTNRYGTIFPATPCPLDSAYWYSAIEQRFTQLAHLSISTQIAGIVFDTEMYGSDFPIYRDFCFCDFCWKRFFEKEQQNIPDVGKEHRFTYLVQYQLFDQYIAFQEEQLQSILAHLEEQIHKITPSLSFGILAYKNTWFYRELIRGFGTAINPVMVFSETSYIRGYTLHVHQENNNIIGTQNNNTQPIARYIPGVWLGRFFPEELPSQLYNLAVHTDGYWIFTVDSLWSAAHQSGPYALHGTNEDYWVAFKKANDELKAFSRDPDRYQSTLLPVFQASFYDHTQDRLITQPSLKSFIRNIVDRQPDTPHHAKITYRGKTLFHCFNNPEKTLSKINEQGKVKKEKGSHSETIRITHIPIGKYRDETHYRFFDSKGLIFLEGSLNEQNRSVEIALPLHVSGFISLLINSGANAAHVFFSELPFVVEASATFPLSTNNTAQTYTFYSKPGQNWIKLRAYCTPGETASLTVQSLNKDFIQKHTVIDRTEINVTIPDFPLEMTTASSDSRGDFKMNGNFWEIAVTPIPFKTFDDIQFYFYNEEFPYLLIAN